MILVIDFTQNSLYYTFSAIPQVLGTLVALLAAFVHFRITRLSDYLIGDGQAAITRWDANQDGYFLDGVTILNKKFENDVTGQLQDKIAKKGKYYLRLKDAVSRKNIYEVKAIYELFRDAEAKKGTKEDFKTGFQYSYEDRFLVTLGNIENLKILTLVTSAFAIFTVLFSLACLIFVEEIYPNYNLSIGALIAVGVLSAITLVLSFFIIYDGLMKMIPHEKGWPVK